ncbi:MAG: pyruvate carboxyltransferase [Proteobacteria bacterium]|nr:pyruvate carboxyltransferase [Pseudomonadota bacterium]MBU1737767.1 pyruvate carboxyltransferase [Pseudomonadota bacterium]
MKGIIDSTLREGEQTVGVSFSPELKLEMIRRLCRIGVEEIEVGTATRYDTTPALLIRKCREERLPARLALWCRCNEKDIAAAAEAGPDVLSLSIPVSDLHLEKKLGKSRAWVLAKVEESLGYARKLGLPFVSLGFEDATRADPDYVGIVVREAARCGVDRIRLADTVGVASPAGIAGLVRRIQEISAVEIGVHMHNDFGMATANSIAAIDSGADWADATILGLGERAGNARLEELAAFLSLQRNHHYQVGLIPDLSRLVAEAVGTGIEPHRPVIGGDIFACETGLHLQGLQREPVTYEPFPPEAVRAERLLLFGAKVGRREIGDCLGADHGGMSEGDYDSIVTRIREMAGSSGYPLRLEKFSAVVRSMAAGCIPG